MKLTRRKILSLLCKTGAFYCISWKNASSLFAENNLSYLFSSNNEHFPVLTVDASGKFWLAVIDRSETKPMICVYNITDDVWKKAATLSHDYLTGIAAPVITSLDHGCVVVFPVEVDGKWIIAYSFLNSFTDQKPHINFIDCPGTSNIAPAIVAYKNRIHIVWESNADGKRNILTNWITPTEKGSIDKIGIRGSNNYNPSVVSLPNGELFAAWDTFCNYNSNIWGAWYRNGKWHQAYQITDNVRIERHPYLATNGNEVWMTWEAQSYNYSQETGTQPYESLPPIGLNYLKEQRIVVAKITNDGLQSPFGFFENISTPSEPHLKTPDHLNFLLRPRIAFDDRGILWLSARQAIHLNAGWLPLIWKYEGDKWDGPHVLHDQQGRWQPVPIAFNDEGVSFMAQYDNLPTTWPAGRDKISEWESAIKISGMRISKVNSQKISLATEPLKMPETNFILKERMSIVGAEFPRKSAIIGGRKLNLYFGDLHEHTDLSVCQRTMNPPGKDLYANLRDIEKLDFCAITDHDYDFDFPQWQLNGEQVRNNNDPKKFVTFLGEEWTSKIYGHHNIVFLDPYYSKFFNAFDGFPSPDNLWEQLKDKEFITIPHQIADARQNALKDWSFSNEKFMPVAEIWQKRMSFEHLGCPRQSPVGTLNKGNYLQDAWGKGIIIGVIASPDHGGGHGKVGVWAEELTRESIFNAIRARHTFGTSGQKMELLLCSGQNFMGDVVKSTYQPIEFSIKACAVNEIKELVIIRNNKIIHKIQPHKKDINLNWLDKKPLKKDHVWYYARILTADEHLAWSSPIWFIGK